MAWCIRCGRKRNPIQSWCDPCHLLVVKAMHAREQLPVGSQCWPPEPPDPELTVRTKWRMQRQIRLDRLALPRWVQTPKPYCEPTSGTIRWAKEIIARAARQLHCRGGTYYPVDDGLEGWQAVAYRAWEDDPD